jgi:hypothetical protein
MAGLKHNTTHTGTVMLIQRFGSALNLNVRLLKEPPLVDCL